MVFFQFSALKAFFCIHIFFSIFKAVDNGLLIFYYNTFVTINENIKPRLMEECILKWYRHYQIYLKELFNVSMVIFKYEIVVKIKSIHLFIDKNACNSFLGLNSNMPNILVILQLSEWQTTLNNNNNILSNKYKIELNWKWTNE